MPIAQGINKQIRYKKQASGLGTPAGTTGGEILRRVTSDLNLTKQTYQSNELRSDAQVADFRHGIRSVEGTLKGELSPGAYDELFANIVRKVFAAGATTGAVVTVTAAVTTGAQGTMTRSAGSYITDGFNVGDVVRWTGWATTGVPNNAHNMLIIALTATVMTVTTLDGVAIGPKAAGDSVTCTVAGKRTFAPVTALTDDYLSFEHWFPDIAQSELFTDCKIGQVDVDLPATGMATVSFGVMGLNITTATAAYFTAPAAQTGFGVLAAVNGALILNGVQVALVTSAKFSINANVNSDPVVGSNVKPDLFRGRTVITGELTAYFQDASQRDLFINETEAALTIALTTGNTPGADFIGFSFPRIKVGGANKDDGEKGLIQTLPFTALLNVNGGAGTNTEKTTLVIQDSQAA